MSTDDNKRIVAGFVRRCRGTHLGELWELPATGNRVEFEFVDIFQVADGKLIEHWTSMDLAALRSQMLPASEGIGARTAVAGNVASNPPEAAISPAPPVRNWLYQSPGGGRYWD